MDTYVLDISCDEGHLKKIKKPIEQVHRLALVKLNESLEQIQLLVLQKQKVTPKPDKSGKIFVPVVGAKTVLVNGDIAPFADVIAPFMLMQAKRRTTSESNRPINIRTELGKCCLLKSQGKDTRLLQGLVELWRGNVKTNTYTRKKYLQRKPFHEIFNCLRLFQRISCVLSQGIHVCTQSLKVLKLQSAKQNVPCRRWMELPLLFFFHQMWTSSSCVCRLQRSLP